ncbi:1813_t:CDS:1 [Scutellospora calospora]|uniref:1813_t:CDS:1 n=1 Tax=Scutellospora calospora TaxID=85575 RepID=A0ACA9LHE8_9GLOM|nr:1813_t:CDS:1 [Scutellospora calospora]
MSISNQVIYQIDEKDEILYEFFEKNLNQLRYYKDAFKDIEYKNEILVVKMIKLHIKEKYIPNYRMQRCKYKFIKENLNVRKLTKCLKIFKETDDDKFMKYLVDFVEYLDFFLYEDYLNHTKYSSF